MIREKRRRLLHGVGINDVLLPVQSIVNGKMTDCIFYSRWRQMLKRCYSVPFLDKYPTYKDCTVCADWLFFSNFKGWMVKQDWQGKTLDKDILIFGNKLYSPETCRFVSADLNKLIMYPNKSKGDLARGVSFFKITGKYKAGISIDGKYKNLGYFKTEQEASDCYKSKKKEIILKAADKEVDLMIKKGLVIHANSI